MQPVHLDGSKGTITHDAGVWFPEPCEEIALLSDQYDFAISLLHLDDAVSRFELAEEPEEDTYDRIVGRTPG